MRKRNLVPKASTTHVQFLQWLHGKQQQHVTGRTTYFVRTTQRIMISINLLFYQQGQTVHKTATERQTDKY